MKFHSVKSAICDVHVALDEVNAQEWGMLAAMFSRSVDGCEELVSKVKREGASGRFMETYYVGYGHESIGDLVDVKLFIEGVPFYVAALLEHHSYFRGQESSTRYIDFSNQRPAWTACEKTYADQINFYLHALNFVKERLLENAKLPEDKKERGVHERAINARAFDITRCFLPLGATTNVAWYGSVRSIKRHLAWLLSDKSLPTEIIPYANQILATLRDVYPQSVEENPRPSKPWPMEGGEYAFYGTLDFGSWRDLNRHRVGEHIFLLPHKEAAFKGWYRDTLAKFGIDVQSRPASHDIDSLYLGQAINTTYRVPDDDQYRYVAKLRSKTSVHPTLREFVHKNVVNVDMPFKAGEIDYTPDPGAFGYFYQRGAETILVRN